MIRNVAVIVPAADEEQRIGDCLTALRAAVGQLHRAEPDVTARIVVVLDRCRDRTEAVVHRFPEVITTTISARCVGSARAAGVGVLADTPHPAEQVWTAHTDADSRVPVGWLVHHVRSADAGADLVLGTVIPSRELPLPTLRLWRALHEAVDDHPYIHGANLGIRASILARLGGWRPLQTGEDVELVERAVAANSTVVRTSAAPVHTSARADGRAPQGFSSYLRALAGDSSGAAPRGVRSVMQ